MAFYEVKIDTKPLVFYSEADNEEIARERAFNFAVSYLAKQIKISPPLCPCQVGENCPDGFEFCSDCSNYYGVR